MVAPSPQSDGLDGHADVSERNSAKSLQLQGVLELDIESALTKNGGISICRF